MSHRLQITCPCGIAEITLTDTDFTEMKSNPRFLKSFLDVGGSPNVVCDNIPLVHGMSLECLKVIRSNSHVSSTEALDINAKAKHDGTTALHEACRSPDGEHIVTFLVQQMNASITIKDDDDCYPLDYAIMNIGDSETHEILSPGVPIDGFKRQMLRFVQSHQGDCLYESIRESETSASVLYSPIPIQR